MTIDNVKIYSPETTHNCDKCGRVFRSSEENPGTCPDCKRLIKLGLEPIRQKFSNN